MYFSAAKKGIKLFEFRNFLKVRQLTLFYPIVTNKIRFLLHFCLYEHDRLKASWYPEALCLLHQLGYFVII